MAKFSIPKRILSFKFAFKGIVVLFKNEHNAWIHLLATFVVLLLGWGLNISRAEWMLIVFAIAMVLVAEGFNTAIEYLANAVSIQKNENIRKAKDVAAGAVLLAAFASAIIGLLIFIPKLIERF
jgi:diacylglycerol kinase (ATP)